MKPITQRRGPAELFRIVYGDLRARLRVRRQAALVCTGSAMGRAGRRILLRPWKDAALDLPRPLEGSGTRVDVVDDLVEYTRLPRADVLDLLQRRHDSFRAEWHLLPPPLRSDDWFYLSSTTYLFGNAIHDPTPLLDCLDSHLPDQGRALDFGGGTGNLAIALSLRGWEVDYLERSALQKDFVTFRRDLHELNELRVLDDWRPLQAAAYDLVCALDVFEHLSELEEFLRDDLLPAINHRGLLAESSPFVRNLSNPMHHEHRGFEQIVAGHGFRLEAAYPEARLWRRLA